MRWIALAAFLILCGCQTQIQRPPAPKVPAALPPLPQKTVFSALPVPTGPAPKSLSPVYVGSFIYPADMTNYVWALEKTTNGSSWAVIYDGFFGPPKGDYIYTNTLHESPLWFRMRGHR